MTTQEMLEMRDLREDETFGFVQNVECLGIDDDNHFVYSKEVRELLNDDFDCIIVDTLNGPKQDYTIGYTTDGKEVIDFSRLVNDKIKEKNILSCDELRDEMEQLRQWYFYHGAVLLYSGNIQDVEFAF